MRSRVARFEVVIVPLLVHYIHYTESSNPPVMERFPRLLKSPSRFPGGPNAGTLVSHLPNFFMSQTIPELQKEVRALQAEVAALQESREKLGVQRSECRLAVSFPKNNTPEAIAEFHQQNAAFGDQWLQQIQEIDRETKITEKKLQQKQALLAYKQAEIDKLVAGQHWQEVENQVQTGEKRLQAQARRINQAAAQLEAEIQALKALYDQLNPSYSEWFQQPTQIVKFSATTIPYAVPSSSGLILENKEIEWEKK